MPEGEVASRSPRRAGDLPGAGWPGRAGRRARASVSPHPGARHRIGPSTIEGSARYGRRVIDESAITRAGELLAAAAPVGSTIILFGSYARGGADEHSDLDFVVIEPEVSSRATEIVRLRDALDPLEISADVVVVSREHAEGWGRVPGTVLFDAPTEGRVLART